MKLTIVALQFVALLVLVQADAKPSTATNSPGPLQSSRLEVTKTPGEQIGCHDDEKSKTGNIPAVVNPVSTDKILVTPTSVDQFQQPQQALSPEVQQLLLKLFNSLAVQVLTVKPSPGPTAPVVQVSTLKHIMLPTAQASTLKTVLYPVVPIVQASSLKPAIPPVAQASTLKTVVYPVGPIYQASTLKPVIPSTAQRSAVTPAVVPIALAVQTSTVKSTISPGVQSSTMKIAVSSAIQATTMKTAVSPAVQTLTSKPSVAFISPAIQALSVKLTGPTSTPEVNKQPQQQTTQKLAATTTEAQPTIPTTQKNKPEDTKKPELITLGKTVTQVVVSTTKPEEKKPDSSKIVPAIHHEPSNTEEDHETAHQVKETHRRGGKNNEEDDNEDDSHENDENDDDYDSHEDNNDEDDYDETLSTFEFDQRVNKEIEKRYMQDIGRVIRFVLDVSNLNYHRDIDPVLLKVSPFKATLKCIRPELNHKIRKNIEECERTAYEIFTPGTTRLGPLHKHNEQHHHSRHGQDMYGMACRDPQEEEIHKAQEMFITMCLIKSIVGTVTNKIIHLDHMKMRMEIGHTSLPKAYQDNAIEDLEKCISTPKDIWHLVEILSEFKSNVKMMITPMVFAMFNNKNERSNNSTFIEEFWDLQVELTVLKGMVCFVESLANNGCDAVNHNNQQQKH